MDMSKINRSKWRGVYGAMTAGGLIILFQMAEGTFSIFVVLGVLTGVLISYIITLVYIQYKKPKNDEEERPMIQGLYEAHLPVSNLERSIEFYKNLGLELSHIHEGKLAFFWTEKDKSWLGLWETDKVELDYHPSIRHIAFQVSLEGLKNSVSWLNERGYEPREAFGFEPTEPFVMAHSGVAHAKIHFNDPDGNSLEFICKLPNPKNFTERMYLSEWEKLNEDR